MTLADVNTLSDEAFVAHFADIAEHSPWVAEEACLDRPFESIADMRSAFIDAVSDAPEEMQLALLRAHPDLATKAKLTPDSTNEQKGAGLETLSAEEFDKFTALNAAYKTRNGFPFIFAVKGATKHQILAAFEQRIKNNKDLEFDTAILQVCRIVSFRLEAMVSP
ncbi:MAG: 2-oxo-4-hydroxy-4-carboxy-5-ureidoimidazoline decarboxylase [Alphaproteobacteria bacterium]|nr:2-oxo-4-hydroxy-4-carboxy-5-ureidoimidazoline decarboxylase [Alphaproteobacteria bacterium]